MITWKYTDQSRSIIKSNDGTSMLSSSLPEGTPIAEPDPTPIEAMREAFESAVRAHLQAGCDAEDYDDITTATGYAGSRVAKWREDTARFVAWRDDVVLTAYAVEQAVAAGAPVPSIEDFRAKLPPLPKVKA